MAARSLKGVGTRDFTESSAQLIQPHRSNGRSDLQTVSIRRVAADLGPS
jgi:hypothetical protein